MHSCGRFGKEVKQTDVEISLNSTPTMSWLYNWSFTHNILLTGRVNIQDSGIISKAIFLCFLLLFENIQ